MRDRQLRAGVRACCATRIRSPVSSWYNIVGGVLYSRTDRLGHTTQYTYDGFGRVLSDNPGFFQYYGRFLSEGPLRRPPTLACALVAAGTGASINRVDKPLLPAILLAFGVGLIHYFSYSRLSRTSFGDIAAAAIESAILFVLTFTCFWIVASRLRRRAARELPS